MEVRSSGDAVLVIDRAEEEEGEKVIVKVVEGGWTSVLPDWAVVSVRSARRCACVSCEETEGEVIEEEVGGGKKGRQAPSGAVSLVGRQKDRRKMPMRWRKAER